MTYLMGRIENTLKDQKVKRVESGAHHQQIVYQNMFVN